jgi:hypothetical protein
MFQSLAKSSVAGALLLLLSGCVEATATITVNPDGRGKIVEEVFMAVMPALDFGGGGNGKEKSLEDMRREAAVQFVTKGKGIAAWKDVSVKWAPDGRLHMIGTAYFEKAVDIASGGEGMGSPLPEFQIGIDNNELKISGKKNEKMAEKKKETPHFAKMTDKELDDYILRQRINYQTSKPLMVMFLTDLKFKMVLRLPGEVAEAKGFKQESPLQVSFTLDGNELLKATKMFMTQDTAALKKHLKAGNAESLEGFGLTPEAMEPSLTVRKMGKAQFDFDKEVQAARAAYPQLRKQLSLDDNTKLPGEK